jgi:hypothetical protein
MTLIHLRFRLSKALSMKTQTVFVANDGSRFDTELAALKYETLLVEIKEAMKPLGSVPRNVKDGKGWVQHKQTNVLQAKRAILKLCLPVFKGFDDLYKAAKDNPDSVHPMGLAGRVLDDSNSPLSTPWHRFCCIDSEWREHQQPYFAINGPKGYHVCIEDRS